MIQPPGTVKYARLFDGKRIKVTWKFVDSDDHGEFDAEASEITINTKFSDPTVLIHELIHAANRVSGWDDMFSGKKEEAHTRMLENALGGILTVQLEDK